jgi:ATP-dependent Zn protease
MQDLEDAKDKVLRAERRSMLISNEEKEVIAYTRGPYDTGHPYGPTQSTR